MNFNIILHSFVYLNFDFKLIGCEFNFEFSRCEFPKKKIAQLKFVLRSFLSMYILRYAEVYDWIRKVKSKMWC